MDEFIARTFRSLCPSDAILTKPKRRCPSVCLSVCLLAKTNRFMLSVDLVPISRSCSTVQYNTVLVLHQSLHLLFLLPLKFQERNIPSEKHVPSWLAWNQLSFIFVFQTSMYGTHVLVRTYVRVHFLGAKIPGVQ